jgi:ribosomal protein L17
MTDRERETESQRLGWQARDNAEDLVQSLQNETHELEDLASSEKHKLVEEEGGKFEAVNLADLQQFANGLLHAIDDLAAQRHVSTLYAYTDLYHQISNQILELTHDTVRQLGNDLKALRSLVDELSIAANEDDVNAMRAVAADMLAAYAPAKTDDVLGESYEALQGGYISQETLTAAQWRELITAFTDKFPEFRRSTRAYLFDMMRAAEEAIEEYGLQDNAKLEELLDEANLLIHVAARPVDFLDVRSKFDEVNLVITDEVVANAPIDVAMSYALSVISEVENAVAQGMQLEEASALLFDSCVEDLKSRDTVDRDTIKSIVDRLKNVVFV